MKQYEKVMHHVQTLADKGNLKTGDRLPSIRSLSEALSLSPASVIKAYQLMEAGHKIYVIPKSGSYWMDNREASVTETDVFDFTRITPDPMLIPFKEFQYCLSQAINLYKRELFGYGNGQGLPKLLETLIPHLANAQLFCHPEQLFITSGSQQALTLLALMFHHLCPQKAGGILVEQPSYAAFLDFCTLQGIPITGIRRNAAGLDFKQLEAAFKTGRYSAFYTMPRCQNPLGTSLSEKDKLRLVSLAEKYKIYIIEDDYLADISTQPKVFPLYYYDTSDRVIYVKSFSKIFLPGIRLGLAILPASLKEPFLREKTAHDISTAVLPQGALELFISSGLYDRHIRRCHSVYKKKTLRASHILSQIVQPQVSVLPPSDGFLTSLEFSDDYPLPRLQKLLHQRGVIVSGSDSSYLPGYAHLRGIRLCYAALSEAVIDKGLSVMVQTINAL